MTQNVLQIWPEVLGVLSGAAVLLLFGLAIALPHRSTISPAESGHRPDDDEALHEEVRPDGYIDSFAKEIEEAGGGLPLVVRIALPGVILWWLIYLIMNWVPS